ncbi:MAG: hypothetical protein ABRQ38_11440 [Candidatus Eremiobacterota bacterium]
MNLLKLSLSGILCISFILIALYVASAEVLYYWKNRQNTKEHLTSLKKVRLRFFTCILLAGIMVMIFTGVNFITFKSPQGFLIFWGLCLLLVFFLFLLPVIDMLETGRMYIERKKSIIKDIETGKTENPYKSKKHYLN